MEVDNIQINESLNLKIGDVLKLGNKLQNILKSLKNTNIEFQEYLELSGIKEFQHINLHYAGLEQTGENADLLFSNTESSIQKIDAYSINNKNSGIITTDLFDIYIFDAIRENEVTIKIENIIDNNHHNNEKQLIERLQEVETNYLMGLITIQERENQKKDHVRYSFYKMKADGKWDI